MIIAVFPGAPDILKSTLQLIWAGNEYKDWPFTHSVRAIVTCGHASCRITNMTIEFVMASMDVFIMRSMYSTNATANLFRGASIFPRPVDCGWLPRGEKGGIPTLGQVRSASRADFYVSVGLCRINERCGGFCHKSVLKSS